MLCRVNPLVVAPDHDGTVEGLPFLVDVVHADLGDLGPGGCLGQLDHGVLGVLHLVTGLERVGDVQKHDPVNFDRHIIYRRKYSCI